MNKYDIIVSRLKEAGSKRTAWEFAQNTLMQHRVTKGEFTLLLHIIDIMYQDD